ncbi:hypothetical protein ACFV9H_39170, partial [Streptomyces sp. NPDC059874]
MDGVPAIPQPRKPLAAAAAPEAAPTGPLAGTGEAEGGDTIAKSAARTGVNPAGAGTPETPAAGSDGVGRVPGRPRRAPNTTTARPSDPWKRSAPEETP